jgi:hypothetical protein
VIQYQKHESEVEATPKADHGHSCDVIFQNRGTKKTEV